MKKNKNEKNMKKNMKKKYEKNMKKNMKKKWKKIWKKYEKNKKKFFMAENNFLVHSGLAKWILGFYNSILGYVSDKIRTVRKRRKSVSLHHLYNKGLRRLLGYNGELRQKSDIISVIRDS